MTSTSLPASTAPSAADALHNSPSTRTMPVGATRYVSSFDAHGGTVYTAEGRPPAHGRWSVKGDQYCSVWEQSGESCYDLERDGDTILWIVPETGKRYPSRLLK